MIDQIRIAKSVEDRAGHNSNERGEIGNALQQNDINDSCDFRLFNSYDDFELFFYMFFLLSLEYSRKRAGLFTRKPQMIIRNHE